MLFFFFNIFLLFCFVSVYLAVIIWMEKKHSFLLCEVLRTWLVKDVVKTWHTIKHVYLHVYMYLKQRIPNLYIFSKSELADKN